MHKLVLICLIWKSVFTIQKTQELIITNNQMLLFEELEKSDVEILQKSNIVNLHNGFAQVNIRLSPYTYILYCSKS